MNATRRVWAIPLASKGFVPVGERNPVHWYLHDYDTDKCVDTHGYATKDEANRIGRAQGYAVLDPEGSDLPALRPAPTDADVADDPRSCERSYMPLDPNRHMFNVIDRPDPQRWDGERCEFYDEREQA